MFISYRRRAGTFVQIVWSESASLKVTESVLASSSTIQRPLGAAVNDCVVEDELAVDGLSRIKLSSVSSPQLFATTSYSDSDSDSHSYIHGDSEIQSKQKIIIIF